MKSIKSEAKLIAFQCIKQFASCKYVPNAIVLSFIDQHTSDPKIKKEAFNQIRRAILRLQPQVSYPEIAKSHSDTKLILR